MSERLPPEASPTDAMGSGAAPHRWLEGRAGVPGGGFALVLGLATAVQALATFAVLALATLAPPAARTLGLAAATVGYQTSLIYIAAALISAFSGAIVRRYGAGSCSLAAMLFGGIAMLGLASASLTGMALASLLIGGAYGLTNPAASTLLQRYEQPRHRNLIYSFKQSGVPGGAVLASLLLPVLAEHVGWQNALAAAALMFFLLAAMLYRVRAIWNIGRDPHAPLRGRLIEGPQVVWADRRLRRLGLVSLCYSNFQLSLSAFAITMLVKDLGWSLLAAGVISAMMQVAGIFGRILWGWLADRTQRGSAILIGIGLVSAALAACILFVEPDWPRSVVIAIMIGLGATAISWNGVFMAEIARMIEPRLLPQAVGGILVFSFLGVVTGPSLFALITWLTGSSLTTFGFALAMPLIGAALLAFGRDDQR